MASNTNQGCRPAAPIDWSEQLQIVSAYVTELEADSPGPNAGSVDFKSKLGRIGNYITDLENRLSRSNNVIGYQQNLLKTYDQLVKVMEEARYFNHKKICRLKDEIGIANKYSPLADGKGDRNDN